MHNTQTALLATVNHVTKSITVAIYYDNFFILSESFPLILVDLRAPVSLHNFNTTSRVLSSLVVHQNVTPELYGFRM